MKRLMKSSNVIVVILVAFFLFSCKNETTTEKSEEENKTESQNNDANANTELTAEVAKAIYNFKYADIPPEAITKAKELIKDNLAVAVASHDAEVLKTMENLLEIDGGDHLILSSGKKGKMLEAIYMNSLASNMLDFDDAHAYVGHPGCTIVQPALVLADHYNKTEEELLEAIVAAYEFNIRWAKAVFDYPNKMQSPFSITLLQSYGTIVLAAKLLDLNEDQIARAFYFGAASMPLPSNQKVGMYPGEKMNGLKNDYGQMAQAMVLAVLTAKEGVYAEPNVLDGPQGLWKMMGSQGYKEEVVLSEIGSRWDINEVQIKPYASCRWSHAAVDGLLALKPKFKLEDVQKIEVLTFQAAANAVSGKKPTNMFEMQFSVPHVFGMIMHDESLIYMQKSSIKKQEVIDFSDLVDVRADKKYEDLFAEGYLPAKVIVTLKNGDVIEEEVLRMKGEMENPISQEEHQAKIDELINSSPYSVTKEYAEKVMQSLK